eukprot:scaffold6675_cov110-Cylindrotheca_fusiformis.AAC.5
MAEQNMFGIQTYSRAAFRNQTPAIARQLMETPVSLSKRKSTKCAKRMPLPSKSMKRQTVRYSGVGGWSNDRGMTDSNWTAGAHT